MSQRTFTRRRFLRNSGAAASVALLGLTVRAILRDGKPTTPRPRAQVRIGSVSLSVQSRKEQ